MNKEVTAGFVTAANVSVLIFCVFAIVLIAFELHSAFKLYSGRKKRWKTEQRNSFELLMELAQTESPDEKGSIFVALLRSGYALSHKLVNAGGKYDDEKQQSRFKSFLTPVAVTTLNSMDGIAL